MTKKQDSMANKEWVKGHTKILFSTHIILL
jgi:hypothetical protein